jgi:glycine cleavage system H protein
MPTPDDRRYSESHEWHKLEGDTLTLGLTRFAVDELTDVTYVEMKPVGEEIGAGETVGEVESVKATSDVYTGVPGEIIEVNDALESDPAALNNDPYDAGWLVKLKVSDTSAYESLMSAEEYEKKHGS